MKPYTKLIIPSLGILLISLAGVVAQNNQVEQNISEHELQAYTVFNITMPQPIKMNAPRVRGNQLGREVNIYFNISADGSISHIHSKGYAEEGARDLATSMRAVIRDWEFEPALDGNGIPISIAVELPVKVVRNKVGAKKNVSIAMTQPRILAIAKL
jgi:hypothetical protein